MQNTDSESDMWVELPFTARTAGIAARAVQQTVERLRSVDYPAERLQTLESLYHALLSAKESNTSVVVSKLEYNTIVLCLQGMEPSRPGEAKELRDCLDVLSDVEF